MFRRPGEQGGQARLVAAMFRNLNFSVKTLKHLNPVEISESFVVNALMSAL